MRGTKGDSASAGSPALAGALDMANNGVAVFPVHGILSPGKTEAEARCACGHDGCMSPGKHPIGEGWQDAATCRHDIIEGWSRRYNCNFGAVCGHRSGVVVVEVDPYQGGRLHDLAIRPTVVSTSGRGHHAFYRVNGEIHGGNAKLGPGLGIRAEGQYVVAPGSMHWTGRRYGRRRWGDFASRPVFTLGDGNGSAHDRVGQEIPEEILDGQQRWRYLLSLAGTLASRGIGQDEIFDALSVVNRKRCRPPKPDADLRRLARWVVEHGAKKAMPEPGPSTWVPVDLGAVAEGRAVESPPSILERTDQVAILTPGKKHLLYGEPESGKGWVAMKAAAARLSLRERVVYFDFEDSAATALSRMEDLGVPLERVLELFTYVRPDGPLDVAPADIVPGATLAVIDGVTEAMQMLGFNPYDNSEVAAFFGALARPLADAGAAVLMLDHVVKDRDNRGRWAIGAQHKMAGSDVCFSLEAIRPFGRGLGGGLSRLTLTKDRPGFLRRHAVGRSRLGDVRFDSNGELVTVRIEPPQDTTEAGFRPTYQMERVSRFLETNGEQSQTTVETGVPGRAEYIRQALRALEAEGYVSRQDGPRGSSLYSSTRPFREHE